MLNGTTVIAYKCKIPIKMMNSLGLTRVVIGNY